jgi:glycosyltransferase involved in cell wall biosynthesis
MFTGGAPQVVRALHLGLRKRGIESCILGLMKQQDAEIEAAQFLGLKSPYEITAFQGIYHYVAKNVKAEDIVHVHLFPPVFYLSLLKMSGRVPGHLVFTEHSTSNRRRKKLLGRVIDTVTYKGYEQVIAVSAGVERELLKWKPELKGRTRVIYNGADLPFSKEVERSARPCLRILSVGNLRAPKNYDNALRAVALLKDIDFEYQIAGKGDWRDELACLCRELGLESKVCFLGYMESVPDLLASADIFLMPSLWEGFGLAAVEAMNASLPLVVSDVPGLREIVNTEPACALLVDPDSPESIADGLRQLLISSDLRFQLGSRAFVQSQKFGIDQMVENYRDLYDEMV